MQHVEKLIIRRALNELLAAGYTLGVYNGEETTLTHSASSDAIMRALGTTDEDHILVYRSGEKSSFGWICLVYGNGWCVISDYTTNLEDVLDPVENFAEKFDV